MWLMIRTTHSAGIEVEAHPTESEALVSMVNVYLKYFLEEYGDRWDGEDDSWGCWNPESYNPVITARSILFELQQGVLDIQRDLEQLDYYISEDWGHTGDEIKCYVVPLPSQIESKKVHTSYVLKDTNEVIQEAQSVDQLKAYAYEMYEIPQNAWEHYYPLGFSYFKVDEGGLFNLFETTEFYIVPKS